MIFTVVRRTRLFSRPCSAHLPEASIQRTPDQRQSTILKPASGLPLKTARVNSGENHRNHTPRVPLPELYRELSRDLYHGHTSRRFDCRGATGGNKGNEGGRKVFVSFLNFCDRVASHQLPDLVPSSHASPLGEGELEGCAWVTGARLDFIRDKQRRLA